MNRLSGIADDRIVRSREEQAGRYAASAPVTNSPAMSSLRGAATWSGLAAVVSTVMVNPCV